MTKQELKYKIQDRILELAKTKTSTPWIDCIVIKELEKIYEYVKQLEEVNNECKEN